MKIALDVLTADQVVGLNRRVIMDAQRKDPACQQQHQVGDLGGLTSCVDSIFMQLRDVGYVHSPLEKMAGLLLYRIAEGQYFGDGNKRTALLSCVVFLGNNGHKIQTGRSETSDLLWGFAKDPATGVAKYGESDAIQFVFKSIYPAI